MEIWGVAARKWARGEGMTAEEWTAIGVKLPIELPAPQHDIDARCQPMKSNPDRYDSEGNWRS